MDMILETKRLYLRKLDEGDLENIKRTLQDKEAMYAYEHAFSDEEASEWLGRQLERYKEYGFGLWAVILKENGAFIGQCGITMQEYGERRVPEIGYLFERKYWHNGYATEAAVACREYAFDKAGFDEVFSIIRDNNTASINVAKRNKMTERGRLVKHYYGMDMPHIVFSAKNKNDFGS